MSNIFSQLFRTFTTGTMRFSSETTSLANRPSVPDTAQLCTVAAGCFWGVEHLYRKHFPDALDVRVGYVGGNTNSPSYNAVCSGRTGHAEAVQIAFDPSKTSYRTLIEFFYRMHDPTTLNRQGHDSGTQYRSAIFTHGDDQDKIARRVTELAQKEWFAKDKITTQIVPAGQWWDAEDYHQEYLTANPGGYQCAAHHLRNFPPLSA